MHNSYFFFQAEDGIRDTSVTGVQTCALPIYRQPRFALRDHGALDGAGRRGAVLARQPREPHPSLYGDGAEPDRSEERRVGKECRSRGMTDYEKRKKDIRKGGGTSTKNNSVCE